MKTENGSEKLEILRRLRTRIHNIGTGAEPTDSDNHALNLIVRLCENSYLTSGLTPPAVPAAAVED